MNARFAVTTDLEALWAAYCTAECRAKASLLIADGIAAGKAWAAWLSAFAPVPGGDAT